jgi:hypothetical protein
MSWCSEILDIEHLIETWLLPALENAEEVIAECDSLTYIERFAQSEDIQRAFRELVERFDKASQRKEALQNQYYKHFISLAIFDSFKEQLSSYADNIVDYIESEMNGGDPLKYLRWPHGLLIREFLKFTIVSTKVNLAYTRENEGDPIKLKRIK